MVNFEQGTRIGNEVSYSNLLNPTIKITPELENEYSFLSDIHKGERNLITGQLGSGEFYINERLAKSFNISI